VLVLASGQTHYEVELAAVDVRRWVPGDHTVTTRLRVPADLVPGSYELGIWLPDAASTLRDDPRYAIHLANDGIWDAASAHHHLATIDVSAAAPGTADASAREFAVIQ
jgi:hypothetical protein